MTRYVIIRLLQGILTLFLASIVIFLLLRLSGEPTITLLPPDASLEDIARLRENLGLDDSYFEQYFKWMSTILKGDLGTSLVERRPVTEVIFSRIPATLLLAVTAMGFAVLLALPIGVLASTRRGKWQDSLAKGTAILGQSIPPFALGIFLILVFAVGLRWLPVGGYVEQGWERLILPAVTLGFSSVAAILRLTRSSMLDVLGSDYVRLARIKGLSERKVVWKHGLRNALIPVVTYSGLLFLWALAGSVVVETIFAWPGLGRLAFQAVNNRDYPVEQGILLIFTGLFVLMNLAVDLLYSFLDPRIRYDKRAA